ncbi:Calx-beta domain-containing protein [Aquimarina sp. M1]
MKYNFKIITIIFFVFTFIGNHQSIAQIIEDFETGTATGWVTSGTASTGTFVVSNPSQEVSTIITQPEDDHTTSPGVNAYFTATNVNAGNQDVDGGFARTTSPIYNITSVSNLSLWYFHGQRDTGDDNGDFFRIDYSLNGGTTYTNLILIGDVRTTAIWREATLNNIPAGSNLRLRITVSDGVGNGDIVEGGIDDLTIISTPGEISIDDVTVNEGDGTATFTVTHSGANVSGPFTIDYTTTNNTALSGSDYTLTSSPPPLTFTGVSGTTRSITVPLIDDSVFEGNESFFLNLSNASNPSVLITDGQGQGIITDNDGFIITDNTTVNTCSGTFFDSGGPAGNYSNNEEITYTICPDSPNSFAQLDFTFFDIEDRGFFGQIYDTMTIHNGDDDTAPVIDVYDDGNPPGIIFATNASGCLTIVFDSDFTEVAPGWEATISCIETIVLINDIVVNESDGTATFQATYNGPVGVGNFTVDYFTVDNTAYATSDYTDTSGTLTFSKALPGVPQNITIPLIDNPFAEDDETFFLNLRNISDPTINLGNGIATIIDDAADNPVPVDAPLTLFDEFNGYFDYALVGGTFRDNVNDQCSIVNSSSVTGLTTPIPNTATITKAYLLWAHSGPAADDVITFEGQVVVADIVNKSNSFGTNFNSYGMISDITSIINSISDPSNNQYDVSDLKIDNGSPYCDRTVVFGGWSLMIFYTEPTLPAVGINFYRGFDGEQNTSTDYTLDGFYAIGSNGSKTTILSWEGDVDLANNESLTISNGLGTASDIELVGDGNNDGTTIDNPFNSTIYDNTAIPIVNNQTLGLDLDTYDISSYIAQGESSVTTSVNVGDDFVLLNAVLLKVPSNLITGTVFEDINYPGGSGRNQTVALGTGLINVTVELYDDSDNLIETTTTDASGVYSFGGMADGDYSIRVVNESIRSARGGGSGCSSCYAVQTFRRNYISSTLIDVVNEVGGANPSNQDSASNVLTGAQSVSTVSIASEGVAGLDFGFNFNTIVNTNGDGQGSLGQFIINSNNLDETGLNIEANGIFDPAAGEDTSIFMIPPTGDPLGRTADINFATGFFDIDLPNSTPLDVITDDATHIDGRTQTAYSGDTNTGTIGSGGTAVGISTNTLPNYDLPEIQVRSDDGDVIHLQASNTVIRNLAVYGGNRRAIRQDSGAGNLITENLLGVNALGVVGSVGVGSYVDDGFEISGGTVTIDGNYIASNTDFGISINGGTSTLIQNNHITNNGFRNCEFNIIINNGSGVTIQNNLINGSASTGIFDNQGNVTISENTITTSGSDNGCSQLSGINLAQNNSSIINNVINTNAGSGIALTGGTTSGNLISQNSIYANGTVVDALGIDIANDGVTINDSGDSDPGPNGRLNFPVFESATISGNTLKIVGWARPDATIEVFLTDINQGTAIANDNQLGLTQDYGEGQIYLGTAIEGSGTDTDNTTSAYTDADGNTDNTNKFNISITLGSTIPPGSIITATATLSNATSEFANGFVVGVGQVITNRRITYRVRPN